MLNGLQKLKLRGQTLIIYQAGESWYVSKVAREKFGWDEIVTDDFVNDMESLYRCNFIKIQLSYEPKDALKEVKRLTNEDR